MLYIVLMSRTTCRGAARAKCIALARVSRALPPASSSSVRWCHVDSDTLPLLLLASSLLS